MPGNTFGKIFKLTTFGESHGLAIGGILDGCPAGLSIDLEMIHHEMSRRKPGQSDVTSTRKEADEVEILSGVFEGKTLGSPIAFLIENQDYRPADYDSIKDIYRPSHADFTYSEKYGHRDFRGGGRASARETAARVLGGAIAKQLLSTQKIQISAFVSQVGNVSLDKPYTSLDLNTIESNPVRCPDEVTAKKMIQFIEELKKDGDSTGGVITCVIKNSPIGLGEPVFAKLHSDLASACMSINAAHGFEYGSGFAGVAMRGSEHNDEFVNNAAGKITTKTNYSGGIQGGISNGMDIYFRVAFKPVSTIRKKQTTINESGDAVVLEAGGRHDPCVVPRAVPIVEAMAALVLADHFLLNKAAKI